MRAGPSCPLLFGILLAGLLSGLTRANPASAAQRGGDGDSGPLRPHLDLNLGQPIGQCRAAPVNLGAGQPVAFLVAYCADFDVDPYPEMFFYPRDTLKLALFTVEGRELWRRDLGRAVVPGVWFTPILPFDLDGDGVDEIYFVGNTDAQHPLSHKSRVLERLDALTGKTSGQWPWPRHLEQAPTSYSFRNFLLGGAVRGRPVLVTAQGTYGDMYLQGWDAGLQRRWETRIASDAPGARGSHMTPVVDWDGDGRDEFFWGERLLRFDDGAEIFCADRDTYDGHSDIIQPVLDEATGRWTVYTCRESGTANYNFPARPHPPLIPRVCLYGPQGERIWGALDRGHMDIGWVARVGPDRHPLAAAVKVGAKTAGPDGRFHDNITEYRWDARNGTPRSDGPPVYRILPVDLDGDGRHEFVRGAPSGDGALFDATGRPLGTVGGAVALLCKLTSHAGEQLLSYHADGHLRLWINPTAQDTPAARQRYAHPFYTANRRLTANGYNLVNLGGL